LAICLFHNIPDIRFAVATMVVAAIRNDEQRPSISPSR
jgi:hypothetical protein